MFYDEWEEEWLYPNYEVNPYVPLEVKHPKKEDYPFQLEHIYDMNKEEYVYNKNQCCYYSPVSKCKACTHRKNCIFTGDVWNIYDTGRLGEISREVRRITGLINDFRRIIDANWNGEIIYHEELGDLYDVSIVPNGNGGFDVSVSVVANFRGRVNGRIRELQMVLRDLSRERFRL